MSETISDNHSPNGAREDKEPRGSRRGSDDGFNLNNFNTGQFCNCGGEIWSDNFGYSCRKCKKNHIISPKDQLNIKDTSDDTLKDKEIKEKWISDGHHHVYDNFVYSKDIAEAIQKLNDDFEWTDGYCREEIMQIIDKHMGVWE